MFLSMYMDDKEMAGRKQNMTPMWKKLMKNVDLDEPTSLLDHENLGCTQRQCKPTEIIIEGCTKMFESRISAGAPEKLPEWETLHAKTVVVSYDMEGHARKCVERYCEGGGDVVGVVTPLVGGVAQAFHGDQVVELRVQLAVQEVEGKEEDREGQVEVEREKRLKEVRSWMTMEMFMTRLRS